MSACNIVDYEATDAWDYENSWSIVDASGNILASGGAEDGSFGSCITDCLDENASNYNPAANFADNTLCEYSLVQGCTDNSACNYDAAAEQDNGSCEFPADGFDCDGYCLEGELLTMNDSYGDGWNGAVLTINGDDFTLDGINDDGISATVCANVQACNIISWTPGAWMANIMN